MDELILEFQSEAKDLTGQLIEILEGVEEDPNKFSHLAQYGNIVDRIMGTAKTISDHTASLSDVLGRVGTYGQICKLVSYKASQVNNNPGLIAIVVALLLDATEILDKMIKGLNSSQPQAIVSNTFLDRLQWVSQQFGENLRGTVGNSADPELSKLIKDLVGR